MNIKKIGLSALAGSLAMVSANAVEYTMSGGAMSTFSTAKGDGINIVNADNGKGFGHATDLGFTAEGELDNGFTVKYFMSVDTNAALANTSSQMTLGMGSLGTIQLNNIAGSKANGIDDISPNAYNEVWDGLTNDTDTTTSNNPSFFGSSTGSGSIDYRIPAQEYMGVTLNASYTYDPQADSGGAAKGDVAAYAASTGSGDAITLQLAHESGIEIGGGYEEVDDTQGLVGADNTSRATGYVKYAAGGLTVSYQESYQNTQVLLASAASGKDIESEITGIAYTAGNVTISYGEASIQTKAVSATAALAEIELESIQAAYVMGAMTVSAAMSETSNPSGVLGDKYEESTLAVSFAF
jgi:hypothetical protein